MTLYMYQAAYTAKSMAAQLTEPHDPMDAIRPVLEELGAAIVVAGFPFGEYDVLIVYEAADDVTAASVAMAVAAAGEVKSARTTRLLSGQEWLESLRKRRIVTARKAGQPHGQLPGLLQNRGHPRVQSGQAFQPPRHRAQCAAEEPRRLIWRTIPGGPYPDSVEWQLDLIPGNARTRVRESFTVLVMPQLMGRVLRVAVPARRDPPGIPERRRRGRTRSCGRRDGGGAAQAMDRGYGLR